MNSRIHFESIDSTNTWAKKNSHRWSAVGLTLVTADHQTSGRGRFNRQWVSPKGLNIYATFCFWIDIKRADMGHIPQLLSLSAALTFEKWGFSPQIKWPNDLLIKGKKVGGILCETIMEHEKRGIVCGIGLNVNMPQNILDSIDRPATSLLAETGDFYDVPIILNELEHQFSFHLQEFLLKGFSPFFPLFKERSALKKGDKIRFHDHLHLIDGFFEKLQPDGSVEIRLLNGKELKTFFAGEFIQ